MTDEAIENLLREPEVIEIEIDRLEFMAAAMFGEARGRPKWTGDAYRWKVG